MYLGAPEIRGCGSEKIGCWSVTAEAWYLPLGRTSLCQCIPR